MKLARIALVPMLVIALFAGTGMAAQTQTATDSPAQAGQAGPPSDLPGPVPDFVEDILSSINDFLSGALDGDLGSVVSDIAGNGSASED